MNSKSSNMQANETAALSVEPTKQPNQRNTRAASKGATAASDTSIPMAASTSNRRTTRSISKKMSAGSGSGDDRTPRAQDIAARASAAEDNEDLRRTIASKSLKRKADSQPTTDTPSKKIAQASHVSGGEVVPQQAPPQKHQHASKSQHHCCTCVDHLRLELAKAEHAFREQEEQIVDLNTEAEQHEQLISQKADYIQRLLRTPQNTKRPVLCTAEEDYWEILMTSNSG